MKLSENPAKALKTVIGIDYAAFGHVIQHCTDNRLLRQGQQLHSRLLSLSTFPLLNFISSKLISFYSKTGDLVYAHKVFDQIPQPNTFSLNALLIGYSYNNMFLHAFRVFEKWVFCIKPDSFTMTYVLKSMSMMCSHYPDPGFLNSKMLQSLLHDRGFYARMMHSYVLRYGFFSDVFVMNPMVSYYLRCDDVCSARSLFDEMNVRDLVTWNSMMAGYSQGGYYEDCKRLFLEMVNKGLRPDMVTVVSVLQTCAHSGDLVLGMDVHRLVVENKIEMDVSVCNALVSLYAKCGSLDYARELFENMSEKDEITYGSMIFGYMVHGFVDQALDVFRKMENPEVNIWNAVISGLVQNNRPEGVLELFRQMQLFGFRPSSVTLSSILSSLSCLSYLKGGREVHCYAIRNKLDANIYIASALIDVYAKMGCLNEAQRVFDSKTDRNVIVWTAIISAYATHGDASAAIELFENMLDNGIRPDQVTFTALLTACGHSGMVDKAWEKFNIMLTKYNIEPSVEHYACMVGVLGRAGKLYEAVEFISKMKTEPSAKVWGALLNGAHVCGDIEIGKIACDRLFEIEPECTGNYIIMANLYSRARRWDEAEEIRRKMNSLGLDKFCGNSWIETSKRSQLIDREKLIGGSSFMR